MKKRNSSVLSAAIIMFVFFLIYPLLLLRVHGKDFLVKSKKPLLALGITSCIVVMISMFVNYTFLPAIVEAYELRRNLDRYESINGDLGIVGEVVVNNNGSIYIVFPECKKHGRQFVLPVKYEGETPVSDHKSIAYGKIKKEEKGEFFLLSSEISQLEDKVSDKLALWIRKKLDKPRKWLYRNCKECVTFSKRFFNSPEDGQRG